MFKKDELKLLWPFYLFSLIFGLSLMIVPFVVIYFRDIGLSFFQIGILTTVTGISVFLFEIPTGAFADGYSRKYSVIIGMLITGISVLLIPTTTNFYILLIIFILLGIGGTFISGAEEAWIIDNLNAHKRKDLHREFFIKSGSIGAFGAVFSFLAGAFLVKIYSINILWDIYGISFVANAILLALLAEEKYKPKRVNVTKALKKSYEISKKGVNFIFHHRTIFLVTIGSIFFILMSTGSEGWTPFLVSLTMPKHYLGFISAIAAGIGIFTPFISKLLVKQKVTKVIIAITALQTLLLLSILLISPPMYVLAVIVTLIIGATDSIQGPIFNSYLHKFIPTRIRATVVSGRSMIKSLAAAGTGITGGILLDMFGPQKVIAVSGLFGIFVIATYMQIKERNPKK